MNNGESKPIRKQIRLREYDYTSSGAYHVIICTHGKTSTLCDIVPPEDEQSLPTVILKKTGETVNKTILAFSEKYQHIKIAEYCIMPNHIHLLVEYEGIGTNERVISLINFVSQLKGSASRVSGKKLWQERFYEHIIRNQNDYLATVKYIRENPAKWMRDEYYITSP